MYCYFYLIFFLSFKEQNKVHLSFIKQLNFENYNKCALTSFCHLSLSSFSRHDAGKLKCMSIFLFIIIILLGCPQVHHHQSCCLSVLFSFFVPQYSVYSHPEVSKAHPVRCSQWPTYLRCKRAASQHRVNSDHLGLLDRAREAVEQEALAAGWRVQVLLDELHHHLVADLHTNTERLLSRWSSRTVARHSGLGQRLWKNPHATGAQPSQHRDVQWTKQL